MYILSLRNWGGLEIMFRPHHQVRTLAWGRNSRKKPCRSTHTKEGVTREVGGK